MGIGPSRQFRLNDMIVQFMDEQGYDRLSYSDIEEDYGLYRNSESR